MREWSLKIFLIDEDGTERPADVFTKVVYNLHPTFANPVQSMFPLLFATSIARPLASCLTFSTRLGC